MRKLRKGDYIKPSTGFLLVGVEIKTDEAEIKSDGWLYDGSFRFGLMRELREEDIEREVTSQSASRSDNNG